MLGNAVADCLVATQAPKGVVIGEGLDGRIITKGLSEHVARSAGELADLVEVAKSRRSTAATVRGVYPPLNRALAHRPKTNKHTHTHTP